MTIAGRQQGDETPAHGSRCEVPAGGTARTDARSSQIVRISRQRLAAIASARWLAASRPGRPARLDRGPIPTKVIDQRITCPRGERLETAIVTMVSAETDTTIRALGGFLAPDGAPTADRSWGPPPPLTANRYDKPRLELGDCLSSRRWNVRGPKALSNGCDTQRTAGRVHMGSVWCWSTPATAADHPTAGAVSGDGPR